METSWRFDRNSKNNLILHIRNGKRFEIFVKPATGQVTIIAHFDILDIAIILYMCDSHQTLHKAKKEKTPNEA